MNIPRITAALLVLSSCFSVATAQENSKPNVLFIALDDLNDWIGVLGGHPQTLTPNIDRLARSGVLFTNAHTSAASCNPSRTALFTGLSPHKTGLYNNSQKMRGILPTAEIIPKTFSRYGYHSAGSGKHLHYFIDAPSWNDYFPQASTENPFPRTLYPSTRPLSLPVGGSWQYRETDWGPLDATDNEYGGDYLVTQWIGNKLQQKHDQPFFLACGIYRPHEPWFVPAKYFQPFPIESIQLPPGYLENDLDDLPPEGKRRGPNLYLDHIRSHNQWKRAIQGYLASIHYADAMVGRVLEALESGPNANNTIVVLWSDHGWHLGEKQHWQKYTAWRACTRVPLIVRVPPGTPGLPAGTTPSVSNKPVSLLSLYPTLLELTGLPAQVHHDGPSLVPLLGNPSAAWPHVALTWLGDPGSYGLSAEHWRLIHYANGDEELYNIQEDPYEWTNLAEKPEHQEKRNELRALAPASFAPLAQNVTPTLAITPLPSGQPPVSSPQGDTFSVIFDNRTGSDLRIYWISPTGERGTQINIPAGEQRSQNTRKGAVWLVTAAESDEQIGYFLIGDASSIAVIPDNSPGTSRTLTGLNPTTALYDSRVKGLVSDPTGTDRPSGVPVLGATHHPAGFSFEIEVTPTAQDLTGTVLLIEIGGTSNGAGLYLVNGVPTFIGKQSSAGNVLPDNLDDPSLPAFAVQSAIGLLSPGTTYTISASWDHDRSQTLRLIVRPDGGAPLTSVFPITGTPGDWSGNDTLSVAINASVAGSRGALSTLSDSPFSSTAVKDLTGTVIRALFWNESPIPPFQSWRQQQFPDDLDEPEISGPDADPDRDGLVNLVEYALNLDPFRHDSLASSISRTDSHFILESPLNPAATDLVVQGQWSNNLSDWSSEGLIQNYNLYRSSWTLRIPFNPPTDPSRFLRFLITRPEK